MFPPNYLGQLYELALFFVLAVIGSLATAALLLLLLWWLLS